MYNSTLNDNHSLQQHVTVHVQSNKLRVALHGHVHVSLATSKLSKRIFTYTLGFVEPIKYL